jgi:cytochrome P450
LPLLGNLLQLDLTQLHRVLQRWADEFGSLYKFQLGQKPVLVVADPELNQTILRNRPKLYARLGTIDPVFKEMGITGVFSAEGEDWKRQRRLTAHALDAAHLRQFFPTLLKVTERLRKRWEREADKGSAVDVQQDLMRYTVDVTTSLAFGYDMNTLENEGDVIQDHLEKIFPAINRRINAVFPYWRYFKLPVDRALDKSLAAIRETITGFVARGRERLRQNAELAEHPTNLLEAMLGAKGEDEAAFTDEEVYGNVLTMLLAGEDTTAKSMAWMMHFMIEYPEV